jgi:protoporphyrinogen oxidase
MGQQAYEVLWQPLFTKKFEDYKEKINMAFFWARVNKRTPALVYPEGGFQNFANKLASYVEKRKVKIHYGINIEELKQSNSKFEIRSSKFDKVISTLPTPLFLQVEKGLLPQNYRERLKKIEYLGAQNLILETEKPILDKTYWLNIAANPTSTKRNIPFGLNWMVAVQHTNFMNRKYYGNKHLLYLAKYTNQPLRVDKLKIKIQKLKVIQNAFIKYAQPLYTPEFVKNKPNYTSPVKGLYFATMEQTYPYDRGTNFAVRVGKEVAGIVGI